MPLKKALIFKWRWSRGACVGGGGSNIRYFAKNCFLRFIFSHISCLHAKFHFLFEIVEGGFRGYWAHFFSFLRLGNMFLKKSPCTFKLHSQRGKIYPREKFYPNKHSHIHISISIDLILLILINSNARSLVHFFHFFQTSQLYKKHGWKM